MAVRDGLIGAFSNPLFSIKHSRKSKMALRAALSRPLCLQSVTGGETLPFYWRLAMTNEKFDEYYKLACTRRRQDGTRLSDDEILKVYDEIAEWLDTDPPEELKKKFVPLGVMESLGIIVDGIHYRRKTGRYAPDYVPPKGTTLNYSDSVPELSGQKRCY